MRDVKTSFLKAVRNQAEDLPGQAATPGAAVNGGGQNEIICPDDYAPIWRTAFALAHNVRFTRTPDVELMRKRAAGNPAYAQQLRITAETTPMKNKAPVPPRDGQAVPEEERETMPLSSAQALAYPVEEQEKTTLAEAIATCADSPAPLQETAAVFISDSAFFEGAPFVLPQRADPPAQADGPVDPEAGADNRAPFAQLPQDVLTRLYRVVECRQPRMRWVAVPVEEAAQEVTAHEAPPAAPVPAASVVVAHAAAPHPATQNTAAQAMPQPAAGPQELPGHAVLEDTAPQYAVEPAGKTDDEENDNDNAGDNKAVAKKAAAAPAVTGRHDEAAAPSAASVVALARPTLTLLPHEIEGGRRAAGPGRPLTHGDYVFPPITLLQPPVYKESNVISQETLERSAGLLESVLEDFGIKGEIIHVRPGPVVTLYEFEPAPGVKSSRVIGLSDDIARSMSAVSARVAVIPGRNVIGIELPNSVREMVYLREIIQSKAFETTGYKLPLALGKNIGGEPAIAELAKMPHLLVAGTTGSGKSVAINTMILSLLYRMPPEKCRLIMVDPKMLELSIYDGIPHLLTPVVTDPKKAVTALKWAVREMENRYRKMAKLGVRNIDGFNARVGEALSKNETIMCTVQAGFDKETGEMLYAQEAMDLTPLPYIVIIVDEMADLMMVAGKEIEGAIQRLAQMARAAGIHLIMATQRPSVDVITGTIKANFPTRISFQVTSKIDSRTILGEQGAETLLGQGDMLHMIGGGRLVRVHGPFVSDREVEHVVAHLKTQGTPEYLATVTDSEEEEPEEETAADTTVAEIVAGTAGSDDSEELYVQAVKVVMRDKKCSTSYIQRRLSIGYNKAASLVERMEDEGLVGPANHVGKREILMHGGARHEGMES